MRCFIVGNGKSLMVEQLNMITGKPSYACNRINLAYDKTDFRPSVYVHPESLAPDIPYIQENIDMGITCWIGEHFQNEIKPSKATHFIKDCHHHLWNYDNPDLPLEWHFPQPCSFGGSVNWAMQKAVMDGFNELILIGCDLEYKDKKPSHFDERYEHGGEQPAWFASRNAFWGHVQALCYIRRKNLNVRVLNATIGGNLHIWERVDLKDVV